MKYCDFDGCKENSIDGFFNVVFVLIMELLIKLLTIYITIPNHDPNNMA